MRWAEYSVFTPMMRTHETNVPEANAQVYDDSETLKKFGRLTRIFKALKPYVKNAVKQNAESGIPVMRPTFLQYEDDIEAFNQGIDFLGANLKHFLEFSSIENVLIIRFLHCIA